MQSQLQWQPEDPCTNPKFRLVQNSTHGLKGNDYSFVLDLLYHVFIIFH